MRVTVAMPLFNKAAEVGRAVEAVLAQGFSDFEVIVVDDGSTDGSGEIVAGYRDPRIRLVRQANAGQGPARHRAILEGRGELVALLDPDDEWLPWFLERGVALLDDFPEAVGGGQGIVIDRLENPDQSLPGTRGLVGDFFREQPRRRVISSSSGIVRRQALVETVPRVERAPVGVDQMLWCPLALKYRFAYDPRVGAVYHKDAQNRSLTLHRGEEELPFIGLLERALAGPLPGHLDRRSIRDFIAFHQLRQARRRIRGGDRRGARRLLLRHRPGPGDRGRWVRYLWKTFLP